MDQPTAIHRRVDLSYGIYLYGWPIQQLLLFTTDQSLPPLVLFVAALLLSGLSAWASWTFIEQPCLEKFRLLTRTALGARDRLRREP